MRIGVYVGSFDPFHKGHEGIVNHLLSKDYVDKIIIIPTLDYWDKKINSSLKDRINMVKLIENDKIEVNTELNTYELTYEILEELRHIYNDLYLIIGADSLIDFDKWDEINTILKNNILVIPRNNIDMYKYINKFKEKDKFIVVNDWKNIEISSTMIRNKLKNKDFNDLDKNLDKRVLEYIKNNKLYL